MATDSNYASFREIIHLYHDDDLVGALQFLDGLNIPPDITDEDSTSTVLLKTIRKHLRVQLQGETLPLYMDADPFVAFIRGGGNVPLYTSLSATLNQLWTSISQTSSPLQPFTVLDVGVGTGEALLPTLRQSHLKPFIYTAEPSAAIHTTTLSQLAALESDGILSGYNGITASAEALSSDRHSLEQFAGGVDVVQMTFSLQYLSQHRELTRYLKWVRELLLQSKSTKNTNPRFISAEFDVPSVANDHPPLLAEQRIKYIFESYLQGLEEYRFTPTFAAVVQGFLIPVMMSKFDTNLIEQISDESADDDRQNGRKHGKRRKRDGEPKKKEGSLTRERTKEEWVNEVQKAGFSKVELKFIEKYWWGDCYMIIAEP
ncbi:putative class I SAM-dependent methyltransferase [Blattamonas nauphoetae]|uniref:Class I SAM-dependent methyltransferase n=1 Tax=Blattamonas nauphoetae TaxID=2049346 RepID=A0ABQ9Y2B0_9EUKA|nr:putative class I SAM-dependent methyltransferase [Blattamonas nauphoetae]